ncbi:DNA polymerase III subunit epsilon [Corynebacterium uropygiale]|uniref:DNA polymerase III subunit epsilon n=1 Tax=Corynebacterium uropygiale TaxID=1775911 RepID=A0A9X1TZT7_9CORY|nr:exonuclease domain-containing protein [Corynebacterium uropygiale]MCF4005718.1 DNA polymerase III subunit epsilon [Corynebacterium uropygiale]
MSSPATPLVCLTLQTTGLHPTTSRIVAIDALVFEEGPQGKFQQVEEFYRVINPGRGDDPGPAHMHGLTPPDVAQAPGFTRSFKEIEELLRGRVLVTFDAASTWGFLAHESRRALSAAARAQRSRRRRRGRGRKKPGAVPLPQRIIDLSESAHRQGIHLTDSRLVALAHHLGLTETTAAASVERTLIPPAEAQRELTRLSWEIFLQLREGKLCEYDPAELKSDPVGMQRSTVRVQAAKAPRALENPGVYQPGSELQPGMEIVISPDIEDDPDELIELLVEKGLAYTEKLTRESSLVVCNLTRDLRGKAMHAQRKGIPLMGDTAFRAAVGRIPDPDGEAPPRVSPSTERDR